MMGDQTEQMAAHDAAGAPEPVAVELPSEDSASLASKADQAVDPQHLRLLEALLFAAAEPLSRKALEGRLPEGADIGGLLTELREHYAPRGVNLAQVGDGWVFRTAPDLAALLAHYAEVVRKLSRAAVETLAIVAYHQPVTRGEIEEIRGVAISKGTLDTLMEAGWIRPRGRRRTPGRPVTWGTTDAFLHHFDLESLEDLPGISDLRAAGLLDASPAIQAYRETELPAAGEEEEEAEAEDLVRLPLEEDPLDDGTEAELPLRPDDQKSE